MEYPYLVELKNPHLVKYDNQAMFYLLTLHGSGFLQMLYTFWKIKTQTTKTYNFGLNFCNVFVKNENIDQ